MSSLTVEGAVRERGVADAERQRRALARWRRHSLLIHVLRVALPAAIVAALLGLIAWGAYTTLVLRLGAGRSADSAIRMVNPKFFGRDGGGKPYFMGAALAVRDPQLYQKIYLTQPVMVMGDQPSDQTKVTADKGVYREDTHLLELDGNVHMHNGEGDDFVTPHALVNTVTNDIDGQAHVEGSGPFGHIASSTYAVRNGGAQVFFTGKVKAHLMPGVMTGQIAGSPAPAMRGSR